MTELATSSPPEPDWVALIRALRNFYADRTSPGARDEAFLHVYQALRFVSRGVAKRKLGPSQGSVTDVSERMVDEVFRKKTFTDFALKFDPDHPSKAKFRTWVTRLLTNEFIEWCRRLKRSPQLVPIPDPDLPGAESEWASLVDDIAGCDIGGAERLDPLATLEAKRDLETGLRAEKKRVIAMHKVLSSLPPQFEDAFLVKEEKETQKAAAKRLGVSLATYKRRRKTVKDLLAEELK